MATAEAKLTEALALGETKEEDEYIKTKSMNLELGIRLRIDQLIEIDTAKQEYVVKGMFDRDWIATEEDVKNHAIKGSGYKPSIEVDCEFINDVSVDSYQYARDPVSGSNTRLSKDSKDIWYNRQRIEFKARFANEFKVHSFPFDVQDLSFVLSASILTAKQMTFVPLHTEVSSMSVDYTWSSVRDWDIVGTDVHTKNFDHTFADTMGDLSDENDVCPYVVFRIQVRRRWFTILARIIIWLFILGLVSLSILSYSPTNIDGRLGFSVTMVLTLIAFQFVIHAELPKVAYLTYLDKYNIGIFKIVVLLTLEAIVVGYDHKGLISNPQGFDQWFAPIACILFAVIQIMFVIYARILLKRENDKIGRKPELQLDRLTNYPYLRSNKHKYPEC